jgi:hypothetical protein
LAIMAVAFWMGLATGVQAQPATAAGPGADWVDRIGAARLALERIDDARDTVRAQRDAMAREHEELAAEIRRRKAERDGAGLIPDFRLQQLLRRSQELAETLTLLNRELGALRQARRERLEKLAQLYDRWVEQTAGRLQRAAGEQRADLLSVLATARQERRIIQRALLPERRPARELDAESLLASDDPEELSERVDALRDEQDRLRRELARLEEQRQRIERESRLDREMRDFIAEQEMFDESSRLLLVPRTPAGGEQAPGRVDDSDSAVPDELGGDGDPSVGYDGEGAPDAPAGEPPAAGPSTPDNERLPAGLGAGDDERFDSAAAGSGLDFVAERRRQIVERLKQVQRLQDRLLEKIDSLALD